MQEDTKEREITELMDTIHFLKELTRRGKEGIHNARYYLIVWGGYILFSQLFSEIFNNWIYTLVFLVPAFFFTTIRYTALLYSILVWGTIGLLGWFLFHFLESALVFYLSMMILVLVAFSLLSRLSKEEKKQRANDPYHKKLGLIWPSIIGSMLLLQGVLWRHSPPSNGDIVNIYWMFTIGICYLILGFFTLTELSILGSLMVLTGFLIGLTSPQLSTLFFSIFGLLTIALGVYVGRRYGR